MVVTGFGLLVIGLRVAGYWFVRHCEARSNLIVIWSGVG